MCLNVPYFKIAMVKVKIDAEYFMDTYLQWLSFSRELIWKQQPTQQAQSLHDANNNTHNEIIFFYLPSQHKKTLHIANRTRLQQQKEKAKAGYNSNKK